MDPIKLIQKLFYYLFTSGLFVALSLLLLEQISIKFDLVNFFAFASAAFFIVNLMQYNVVDKKNPSASRGFLIHTLFGVSLWVFLAILMFFLHKFNFQRGDINSIVISTIIFGFLLYFYCYYKGFLNF
tara:strand:+ start:127 stop:510 length:384 start_codon:yes stop_codon:yes gene_type:complete